MGDFLSGLRQPVLSSVVNGASVLRRYRHWQGLQWATAEGLWAEPHYSTVTGASVRAGILKKSIIINSLITVSLIY